MTINSLLGPSSNSVGKPRESYFASGAYAERTGTNIDTDYVFLNIRHWLGVIRRKRKQQRPTNNVVVLQQNNVQNIQQVWQQVNQLSMAVDAIRQSLPSGINLQHFVGQTTNSSTSSFENSCFL